MAQGDINLTIVGNITNDPELRFTPSGAAVASFTVASNSRYLDKTTNEWKDGEPVFMRCSVWRQYAENVAESLTRGTRVIVTGRLKQRSYDNREGQKVTVMEMEVDDVGPALRTATAKVTKVARSGGGFGSDGGGFGGGSGSGGSGGSNDDPWASQSGGGGSQPRPQSSGGGDSWGGGGGGQSFDEPPF
jgi:single-strand DNA-binding protein